MNLIKTFALVAVSAGVGGYVGDRAFALLEPRLPASVGPGVRTGAKLGFQAGAGVVTFAVLSSFV